MAIFANLKSLKLGDGECASIAAALHRGLPLAIDDIRAAKKASARDTNLTILDTITLMLEAIRAGLLSVAEADAIKLDWEENHRFAKKTFSSFAELVS